MNADWVPAVAALLGSDAGKSAVSTGLTLAALIGAVFLCDGAAKALVRYENRRIEREEAEAARRRHANPQGEPAPGPGSSAPRTRTPPAPSTPVTAAAAPRPAAVTGHHLRRVTVHG